MRRSLVIALWRTLAIVCVALALLGSVLPVLPTVPFLLVAAWAGSRGWPQLEAWLLQHPKHGPAIQRWRDHGAVPRRAKVVAIAMMLLSAAILALSGVPLWLKLTASGVMTTAGVWLWLRPEV